MDTYYVNQKETLSKELYKGATKMQFVILVEMPLSTDLAIFCVPEEAVVSLHSSKPMQTQTSYRPMGKTSKSKDIALEELFFLRSKTTDGHLCLLPIAQDEKPFEYGPTTYKRVVQFNSQGLDKFRTAAPKSNSLVSYLQGKSATVDWNWKGFTLEQSAEMWTQIGVQKVKQLEAIGELAEEGLKQINLVLQGSAPHNTSEKVQRLQKA